MLLTIITRVFPGIPAIGGFPAPLTMMRFHSRGIPMTYRGGILITGKTPDLLMRPLPLFSCVLIVLGCVLLSGCTSSDDKFADATIELGNAAKPHLDLLNQSIAAHDFPASQEQCRQLIVLYDAGIPNLSAIAVSTEFQPVKQYMVYGFENERTGCQLLITSSDDTLGPSMEYFRESANNFSKAADAWPS